MLCHLFEIIIEVKYWILKSDHQNSCSLQIYNKNMRILSVIDNYIKNEWGKQKNFEQGLYCSKFIVPKNFFNEGTFDINIVIFLPPGDIESSHQVMYPKGAAGGLTINISDLNPTNTAKGTYPYDWDNQAILRPKIETEVTKL